MTHGDGGWGQKKTAELGLDQLTVYEMGAWHTRRDTIGQVQSVITCNILHKLILGDLVCF